MDNNLDWTEISDPMWECDNFIDAVLDKVFILDILDRCKVEYSPCRTGDFSQRAKCPFPKHLDGGERTASLFISEENNSFYCFGCNSGGDVIRFIELYFGKPFHESLKLLGKIAGITKDNIDDAGDLVKFERYDPEKDVITHVSRTGVEIRNFLSSMKGKSDYNKWCRWADKRFDKLDEFLDALDQNDWEVARDYHDKVVDYLKRYK